MSIDKLCYPNQQPKQTNEMILVNKMSFGEKWQEFVIHDVAKQRFKQE